MRDIASQVASFERLGYRLMEVICPALWSERGTTLEGVPRGYTVDATAGGGTLVAEMSAERDYFFGSLAKAERDLRHAISEHPHVEKVWLLAAMEAPAGSGAKIAALRRTFINSHPRLESIEVLGARELANVIFENLESERFVQSITPFLPSVARLADEYVFAHRVPRHHGYRRRAELEKAVSARILASSCVVVRGISGIGKSALVAQVATELATNFSSVIWVDAQEMCDARGLYDVDVLRTGVRHNLVALLKRRKCLLILDDVRFSAESLEHIELGDSRVILTCQASSDPHSVLVSDLDEELAFAVLNTDTSSECPSEVFRKVFLSVGGHPLLLAALNRIARAEGWVAVEHCCGDAATWIEDDKHQKICQRILRSHTGSLQTELKFVRWVGESRISSELVQACVSTGAVRNLAKRGFLAATTAGHIRIHDIVFQATSEVVRVDPQDSELFRTRFVAFLREQSAGDSQMVMNIASLHLHLLCRLITEKYEPALAYAVALVRDRGLPLHLLGDPVELAGCLIREPSWYTDEATVRSVIEIVEAGYTVESATSGADQARLSLQRNIKALEVMADSCPANARLKRDIRHHHAKMLTRLGNHAQAERIFRNLVDEEPNFAAAQLQLARLCAKQRRAPDALNHAVAVLETAAAGHRVSVRVLLGALELVAREGHPSILSEHSVLIERTVNAARASDLSLAVEFVAGVCAKVWFHLPQFAQKLYESLDWQGLAPARDEDVFAIAQAHKAAGKATRSDSLLRAAAEAYGALSRPSAYHLTHYAEALCRLERYDDALEVLGKVPAARRNAFWLLRQSQGLNGIQEHGAALSSIEEGIAGLAGDTYRGTFLAEGARALEGLGRISEARQWLFDALKFVPEEDPYHSELQARLAKLAGQAGSNSRPEADSKEK